jgi:hypothetical protein
MSLFDAQEQRVSAESLDKFNAMFNLSAEILNEFAETPVMINSSNYATRVYEKFPRQGVKSELTSASLTEIRYDSAGYYVAIVLIEKKVYNLIKSKNKAAVLTKSGRCFIEYIRFDVSEKSDRVRIQQITGELNPSCPSSNEKEIWIGPELIAGTGNVVFTPRAFLGNSSLTQYYKDFSLEAGTLIGAGGRIQYPIANNNKIYFTAGLSYVRSTIQATLDTLHFRFPNSDIDKDLYEHDASLSDIREKITISGLEFAPGLGAQMFSNTRISVTTDLQFLFRSATTQGELTGNGAYKGIYAPLDWVAYGPEFTDDYGFYNYQSYGLPVKYGRKFSYGFRISPSIQFKTSDNMAIRAGIEYDALLNSPFETTSDASHILRFTGKQERENEGLGYNYTEKVRYSSFNIRVGILYKIQK